MQLKNDGIVILDYGSQTAQLIARRVREIGVYAALLPFDTDLQSAQAAVPNFRGIILSGSPSSVYDTDAPSLPGWVLNANVPVLGICYGMQLLAHTLGGQVIAANKREFGQAALRISHSEPLFAGLPTQQQVWMSHGDQVRVVPDGFIETGLSEQALAAMMHPEQHIYGLQFHPEVSHTPQGTDILRNFVTKICEASTNWNANTFIETSIQSIREQVGQGKVLLALSGGVDSAVAGSLLEKAIGDQLVAVFVNTGLLRQGEADRVIRIFGDNDNYHLHAVDATEDFLGALQSMTDPEEKRRTIGEFFIRTFEHAVESVGEFDWLAQGTIYPDVIESAGSGHAGTRKIKSHHNVGGLPERMRDKVIEPLRDLFKDEVRNIGLELGLPEDIIWRQPFPGPGLAIRCLGEVTWQRLETLRKADYIFTSELEAAGMLRDTTAQAFAVLLPVQSVGVMGDKRTYEEVIALRAITTDDYMTADWARLPYDLLAKVSSRIVNEVPGVNRVTYDISSKPPATIEWE